MSTQRIDYYDSPEAPRANSLVPAVNVVGRCASASTTSWHATSPR
ncbi:MAG TPA: hypothetical protein VMF87_23255 [Streptosporangiaceae bacterium]|nr:hypothetical protein [Streptosporangiaceae bacterium]